MSDRSGSKPKILISACLMGEAVRYDGDHHKMNDPLIEMLQARFELVALCPEVRGGLTIPRLPCEIDQTNDRVYDQQGQDQTAAFDQGAKAALICAQSEGIRVALLKERSPSCGVNEIFDGCFQKKKIKGQGKTTRLLSDHDIACFSEENVRALIDYMDVKDLNL